MTANSSIPPSVASVHRQDPPSTTSFLASGYNSTLGAAILLTLEQGFPVVGRLVQNSGGDSPEAELPDYRKLAACVQGASDRTSPS